MRLLTLACGLPFLLAAGSPRVLVYSYTFESAQTYDNSDKAYGLDKMDPQGGGTFMFHNVNQHYRSPDFAAPQQREGTLSVAIVGTESDGGLVVRVSEPATTAADAGAGTTCVAFADTTLVCDPNRPVSPEADAVLALMGPNFVDASRMDALRRWHTAPADATTQADFRVVQTDGNVMEVAENATRAKPGSPLKAGISAAIVYDATHSLPLTVDQTTVEHVQRGVVAVTITTHAVLKLQDPPHR